MPDFTNNTNEMNYLDNYINTAFQDKIDTDGAFNNTDDYLTDENTYKTKDSEYKKLTKILDTRKKMLEVNLERNDVKNKIIYMLFSFIMIMIIIMISIHSNFKT